MGDLEIDTDVLVEAGRSLRVVATEFEHANANSDRAAEAVGDDRLADRVRDFAHNWDDKRGKILKNIGTLAEAATGVGEAFEQLETDFVAATPQSTGQSKPSRTSRTAATSTTAGGTTPEPRSSRRSPSTPGWWLRSPARRPFSSAGSR